jgi:hypothetical protein
MSAVMISSESGLAPAATRQRERPERTPAGMLADGTPFYAPIGEVLAEDWLIVCHLCGRALRSVTAHLRVHGWTKDGYCEAFGLERSQSLEGHETRKLRAAAFSARLVFDPAVREGSAAGRQRARAGDLTRDATAAARGRQHPEQRRRKQRQALAAIPAAPSRRRTPSAPGVTSPRSRRGWPRGRGTPTSARSCWPGWPPGPAWRR